MGIYFSSLKTPERCEECLLCHMYETPTETACGCKINMRTREKGCKTRPDWCPITDMPDAVQPGSTETR